MRSHSFAWTSYESPLGTLTLSATERGLSGLHFPGRTGGLAEADRDPAPLAAATLQLDEYFARERRKFDLELDQSAGTPFQRAVWRELQHVPYGETVSYGELARRIGRLDRIRAVGGANARNPLSIVVPCHRVVGADGGLTGYGGGLERKRALLDLEAGVAALVLQV